MNMRKRYLVPITFIFFCLINSVNAFYGEKVSIDPVKQKQVARLLKQMEENVYQDLGKVLELGSEAITVAEEIYSVDDLLKIYSKIGLCYENHNQQDSALIYYNYALEYAEQLGDESRILSVYNDLAITYRRKTLYKESKDYYLKALAIARKTDNKLALENTYHGLGSLHRDIGDYENAVKNFLESIKLAELRDHQEYVIHSMQFLALTYAESGKSDSALRVIQDAVDKAKMTKDTILNGIVFFDYGKILSMDKNFSEAQQKFEKSLECFQSIGHKPLIARSLFYLADNYSQQGDFKTAHDMFIECTKSEQFISLRGQTDLNFKLGELYMNEGDVAAAKKFFEKSLSLSEKQSFKDFSQKNHHELYKIYESEENQEKTLFHLTRYSDVRDSLFNEERTKAITEMQFKYQSEKSQRDIEKLQNQQERTAFISFLALFFLLAIGFGGIAVLARRNNNSLRVKNAEINSKNVKLKESNEVLQQFAYVAAHDLKEPLRSIGSFTNLIQRRYGKDLNEEANEYMGYVQTSVKRMDGLLRSLLEYSGITMQQSGSESVSTRNVVQGVLQNLHNQITKKNARIEAVNLLNVSMKEMHLTQLLQNLIGNSIKYSDRPPHIQISTHLSNGRVYFTLTDNGIGMDAANGEKVFNLFYQEDKAKQEGSGIGLAICKNIIEKYDGEIYYDSKQGKGTTFFFDLPAA